MREYQERKKELSCIVDTLLKEQVINPKQFTDNYVHGHVDAFIFVGHDSVSLTLTFALFKRRT